jgi:hypothetical protein
MKKITYKTLLMLMFTVFLILHLFARADDLFLFYWLSMVAMILIGLAIVLELEKDKNDS